MPEKDHFTEWMCLASAPRLVLLVDDSKDDTKLLVDAAAEFNVQWEVAYDGSIALELLRKDCKYQLIILDLKLNSDPDGVDLFRHVKTICPLIPVLVLSGHITSEVIDRITRIGFAMFAQKPSVFNSSFFEQLFMALNIPKNGTTVLKNKESKEGYAI